MIVVTVARRPLGEQNVAGNLLTHEVGALNINASRVGTHTNSTPSGVDRRNATLADMGYRPGTYQMGPTSPQRIAGRWPSNMVLVHQPNCYPVGESTVQGSGHWPSRRTGSSNVAGITQHHQEGLEELHAHDESVTVWACESGCPVAELDASYGTSKSGVAVLRHGGGQRIGGEGTYQGSARTPEELHNPDVGCGDAGGASRFFKQVGGTKS